MVNEKRILKQFMKLVSFDSESFSEKEIGEYLVWKLKSLGLLVNTKNTTGKEYLKNYPDSHPNIYAFLKGDLPGDPILFSAHMDTVVPGKDKEAVITEDGFIKSVSDTVLGADDISGLVSIIEALSVIKEKKLSHPDIEILFTVSEEPFCEGSRFLKYDLIKAKKGYVLDLTGSAGTAAISAPTILSFEAVIKGRSAHAGFAPEEGINAIKAAADAISNIKTGRVDGYTTVNVGTIEGGSARNIVPDLVKITGEIRSLDHKKALDKSEEIKEIFDECCSKIKAKLVYKTVEHIRSYTVKKSDEVVKRFGKACSHLGIETEYINTYGGSDANRLNEAGIKTIVYSCGMENVHTTGEYVYIKDLIRSSQITLTLMTENNKAKDGGKTNG